MAIQSNDSDTPNQSNQNSERVFASAPSGSHGGLDFLGLTSNIGIPRIDASVEPYLTKMMEEVRRVLPSAELIHFQRRDNYHAVKYVGPDGVMSFFGIMFVATTDGHAANFYPSSMRMMHVDQDLSEMYPGQTIRLIDQRLIIANYGPEMDRWFEMANTIVMAFNVTTDPRNKDAVISQISTVEFSPDWSITNVRAMIDKLSPHAVRGRVDIGMVLRAKVSTNNGGNKAFSEFDTQYKPVGVIGGYVEFKEKEPVQVNGTMALQYTPVFNITTTLSTIPLEGMWAVLVAAIAPAIYNSKWWARQWTNLSKDLPNPGVLEMDPERNGQPYFVESQEDLIDFLNTWCTQPQIAFQMQDGRDAIPGLFRMFSDNSQEQAHFINRLMHFFEADGDISLNAKLSDILEFRFDGVYGLASGELADSREIDYLSIAARAGAASIPADGRRTLLGVSDRPQDRAQLVSQFTGNFVPLYFDTVSLINPTFIGWIIDKIKARGLAIIDPNHQAEGRTFSSFTSNFGSGQGIGSVIQSGIVRPGLNLSSMWNR